MAGAFLLAAVRPASGEAEVSSPLSAWDGGTLLFLLVLIFAPKYGLLSRPRLTASA